MIQALLGTKKGMIAAYDSRGRRVGATIVEMQPNLITQVKSKNKKDGYNGIQLGVGSKKSVKKPQLGHLKKAGIEEKIRWMREVRLQVTEDSEQSQELKPGKKISLDQVFSIGDEVKVTGTSKGKGFQGGVRRHGFHGGPKTHGQSDRHRAPGSIGSGTTPGRVYKGKKMAGHMGMRGVSLKGLEVVAVDKENNILTIKGGVPGSAEGLLMIEKLGRIKGYTPPPEEKPEELDNQNDLERLSEPENQRVGESENSIASDVIESKEVKNAG